MAGIHFHGNPADIFSEKIDGLPADLDLAMFSLNCFALFQEYTVFGFYNDMRDPLIGHNGFDKRQSSGGMHGPERLLQAHHKYLDYAIPVIFKLLPQSFFLLKECQPSGNQDRKEKTEMEDYDDSGTEFNIMHVRYYRIPYFPAISK
jgi:hypothetical protein